MRQVYTVYVGAVAIYHGISAADAFEAVVCHQDCLKDIHVIRTPWEDQ